MAFDVHEEVVFPIPFLARAGFDEGHVDADFAEGVEYVHQSAGLVVGGEHDRGFIVAGGLSWTAANDEKTGHVVDVILDILAHNFKRVELGGECAADGGGMSFLCSHFGGFTAAG